MPSQDLIDRFNRDGFVKSSRMVDQSWLLELRSELTRVIDHQGKPGPQPTSINNLSGDPEMPVWQICNIWEASDAYRRLLNIPELVSTVAALLGGREIRLWHDQIQFKPEGRGGINNWHQDWPYWPTMSQPNALTAWIAIDDAFEDNGCMSMVPGSHRWGPCIRFLEGIKPFTNVPREWEGHAVDVRLCPVEAGAVHFHHSLTWHGSHANLSPRPRRAIALHFMNETVCFNKSQGHLVSGHIESQDGEPIRGERFPLIWQDGRQVLVPSPRWQVQTVPA